MPKRVVVRSASISHNLDPLRRSSHCGCHSGCLTSVIRHDAKLNATARLSQGAEVGRLPYADTVSKTAAMQRQYDGNQPGDPAKAAAAIIEVTQTDTPPLRLVLGSDAYARAERTDEGRLAELRAWRTTSVSTDFPRLDLT